VRATFCVECGKESEGEEELRGGLCLACFVERNPVLLAPDVVDLVRCPSCGSVRRRGLWTPPVDPTRGREEEDGEALRRAVQDAAEGSMSVVEGGLIRTADVDVRPESRGSFVVTARAEVGLMGGVVGCEAVSRVRVRGEVCPTCSRMAGSYYEALVQFRGAKGRPATPEELDEARRLVEGEVARLSAASRDVGITKMEEQHGGLDFYLTSHSAGAQIARSLSSRFNATSTSSTSMAGRRDGRDLVRVTHAVRLPELRRGDFVMLRGEPFRVVSATDKEATVDPPVGTGRRRRLTREERAALRFVGDGSAAEEAVVVSRSGPEVQVLDPVTLRTVDLPVPPGFDPGDRETVQVLRVEDELFLVG
jgi:nonsense-mediated mRNA decay protein 3